MKPEALRFCVDVLPAQCAIEAEFGPDGRVRFTATRLATEERSEPSGWFTVPEDGEPAIALTWGAFWP